jgi:hypothetical protein
MAVSDSRIILHFDIHEPIELMDLTLSFASLAQQYRKFLSDKAKQQSQKINEADVKLYITKIENNCILAELAGAVNILGSLMPLADYTNTFVEFMKNINNAILYFQAVSKKETVDVKNLPYSKKQCEQMSDFLSVVANNKDGRLGLSVATYEKEEKDIKHKVSFEFKSEEAHEAQKGALIAQAALEHSGAVDHENVLMYFHQTNLENPKAQGRTGDRGVIKSIYSKPLPVYFISDLDRDKVKTFVDDPNMNPFKASYRVDVNVETDRNDRPKFYRVMKLHEIID